MLTLQALESGRYTIEEIDAITGPALGRPKSATFRTMDIAGIDILAHVATQPRASSVPAFVHVDDREGLGRREGRPGLLQARQDRGRQRDPDARSGDARRTGRSSPRGCRRSRRRASIDDTGERIKTLFHGTDKVGDFLRETLGPTLRLHRQGHARHRLLDRRRRSRDAVGIRLGARTVRDHGRDRHPECSIGRRAGRRRTRLARGRPRP